MSGVYLVGHLDLKQHPPVVVSVDLYSSDAKGLTTLWYMYAFDIISIQSNKSYHELRIEMIKFIASKHFYDNWVLPFLTKSLMAEVQKAKDEIDMNEALE